MGTVDRCGRLRLDPAPAEPVQAQVHAHAEQPGSETPRRVEPLQPVVHAEEGFLGQVASQFRVTDQARQHADQLPLVTAHQDGEGGVVSMSSPFHQPGVVQGGFIVGAKARGCGRRPRRRLHDRGCTGLVLRKAAAAFSGMPLDVRRSLVLSLAVGLGQGPVRNRLPHSRDLPTWIMIRRDSGWRWLFFSPGADPLLRACTCREPNTGPYYWSNVACEIGLGLPIDLAGRGSGALGLRSIPGNLLLRFVDHW